MNKMLTAILASIALMLTAIPANAQMGMEGVAIQAQVDAANQLSTLSQQIEDASGNDESVLNDTLDAWGAYWGAVTETDYDLGIEYAIVDALGSKAGALQTLEVMARAYLLYLLTAQTICCCYRIHCT